MTASRIETFMTELSDISVKYGIKIDGGQIPPKITTLEVTEVPGKYAVAYVGHEKVFSWVEQD